MKESQARWQSSELPCRFLSSGCFRGSLLLAHSFSLAPPLRPPSLPDSLWAIEKRYVMTLSFKKLWDVIKIGNFHVAPFLEQLSFMSVERWLQTVQLSPEIIERELLESHVGNSLCADLLHLRQDRHHWLSPCWGQIQQILEDRNDSIYISVLVKLKLTYKTAYFVTLRTSLTVLKTISKYF